MGPRRLFVRMVYAVVDVDIDDTRFWLSESWQGYGSWE